MTRAPGTKNPAARGGADGVRNAHSRKDTRQYPNSIRCPPKLRGFESDAADAHRPTPLHSGSPSSQVTNSPVFRLDKTGGRAVIAQFSEHGGRHYLDVRLWVMKVDELLPTSKGVTVPLEAVKAFGEALSAALPPSLPAAP